MRLLVLAPGRPSHPGAVAWTEDLYGRIARILPLERKSGRQAKRGPGGLDLSAKSKESAALIAMMPAGCHGVALDVGGQVMDSDRFAAWLIATAETGCKHLCFLIGGPDGLDPAARSACRTTLSLGPMVLPHEMAEVVLAEQIYRALTRWKNLPYHR